MTLLLVLFTAASMVLWLSVYGYLLVLAALAGRRRAACPGISDWPDVTLVIPTLNEAQTIAGKLADVARTEYPADKLHVVVVDGGSVDGTVDQVHAAMTRDPRVALWRVAARGSKAHQVNYAMQRVRQELVVVTDADARLDPSCVRALVSALIADPRTAIVGASIRVATDLPEERLHWWGINQLWWLEGEALSAGIVSGVCYAARRAAVAAMAHDAGAEDVHLSLRAAARGLRVRLCRAAWATEVRVPHGPRELVRLRRRRGADYLRELRRAPVSSRPIGARVARWIRLFHFRVTPVLAATTAGMGLVLCGSPHWRWPLWAACAFLIPPAVVLGRARSLPASPSRAALAVAAGRLAGLLWISLLALRVQRPAAPAARAGRERHVAPRPMEEPPVRVFADQEVGS